MPAAPGQCGARVQAGQPRGQGTPERGQDTKARASGGGLAGVLHSARGTPPPGTPGLRTQGRARPPRPRGGPGSTPSLHPGAAGGASSASAGGRGGPGGGRYLGAVLQSLLQQQLVHGGHRAARRGRGPEGRTQGRRRGRRGCSRLRRPGGRSVPATAPRAPRLHRGRRRLPGLLPALSSPPFLSPPLPRGKQEVWRAPCRTPEVWPTAGRAPEVWRPLRCALALWEAADPPAASLPLGRWSPRLGAPCMCQAVQRAREGNRGRKIRPYLLWLPRKPLNPRTWERTDFAAVIRHFFF